MMLNRFTSDLFKILSLSGVLLIGSFAVVAQTPTATPPANPAQKDATRPPGTETQNPGVPPGTQQTAAPQAPPGNPTVVPQTRNPQAPVGTEPAPVQDPQEPKFPTIEQKPLPPIPNMTRLGVTSDNTLTLSMNDAIKRALENNNDIEIARHDVRFAETQLRSLEGVYDPFLSFTPQIDKRVTPVQNIFAGGGTQGQVSTTTYSIAPTINKSFSTGGGDYQLSFSNSKNNTSAANSTLNPFYSSNLSLSFTQPLWRDRSIDNNRRQIRIQKKRLEQSDADFRLRQLHVFPRAQHRQQKEALEDEADARETNAAALAVRQRRDLASLEAERAAGRRIDAADQVEQGRLPAARWARDREVIARINPQRCVTDDSIQNCVLE